MATRSYRRRMPADARPRIGGYITEASYEGWHEFAASQGVTVTALVEALGLHFSDRKFDLAAVVAEARTVTTDRFRRKRRRG